MSLIKEKIRFTDEDINIKISFGSNDNLLGLQQEIDKLTQFTAIDLVNPVNDLETRRFKHFSIEKLTLSFEFYSPASGTYLVSFFGAGFLPSELQLNNSKIQNSFFILDFYDSFDPYNQTKIFSSYLTKIITSTSTIPSYEIKPTTQPTIENQFYRWHVPISLIEQQSGDTIIGYAKFSFYNAKTGRISLFFNKDNTTLQTTEKQYFKTELNLINRTWKLLTPSYNSTKIVTAREYPYTTGNNLFIDRVNNTVNKFNDVSINFPTGNTFSSGSADYVIT